MSPGSQQAVRIQWIGEQPDVSRSFTLYARELAVDLEEGASGVRTLMRIGASVHITTSGLTPEPRLATSRPVEDGVEVTLENIGNEYIYIDDLALDFDGQEVVSTELAVAAGRTLLLPGAKRTFVVPDKTGTPVVSVAGD